MVRCPVLEVLEVPGAGLALAAAARELGPGDWLVVTSANAVEPCAAAMRSSGPGGCAVAAVGRSTEAKLRERGVDVALVADPPNAAGLVERFPEGPGKALYAAGDLAGGTVGEGLAAKGWELERIDVYSTRPRVLSPTEIAAVAGADAVTLFSSSAVHAVMNALTAAELGAPVVVCAGQPTAATAAMRGLRVDAVAADPSPDGVCAALVAHFAP